MTRSNTSGRASVCCSPSTLFRSLIRFYHFSSLHHVEIDAVAPDLAGSWGILRLWQRKRSKRLKTKLKEERLFSLFSGSLSLVLFMYRNFSKLDASGYSLCWLDLSEREERGLSKTLERMHEGNNVFIIKKSVHFIIMFLVWWVSSGVSTCCACLTVVEMTSG